MTSTIATPSHSVSGTLARALYLRRVPVFADLDTDTITAVAQQCRERLVHAGDELLQAGAPPHATYIVVEGAIEVRRHGLHFRDITTAEQAGTIAFLAEDPDGIQAIAKVDSLVLELRAEDISAAIDNDFRIFLAILKSMARDIWNHVSSKVHRSVLDGPTPLPHCHCIDLMGRVFMLHRLPLFDHVSINALVGLARLGHVRDIAPGEQPWKREHELCAWLIIVKGTIQLGNDHYGPGHSIGLLRSIAGAREARDVVTTGTVRALCFDEDALFEVMEDRSAMANNMLRTLARIMMQAYTHDAQTRRHEKNTSKGRCIPI